MRVPKESPQARISRGTSRTRTLQPRPSRRRPTPRSDAPRQRSGWEIFKGWHSEPSFYREVYARTVATITSVGVVYVLGVFFGYFNARPLVAFSIIAAAYSTAVSTFLGVQRWRKRRREKSGVRLSPAEEEASRRQYGRLLIVNTLVLGVVVVVTSIYGL